VKVPHRFIHASFPTLTGIPTPYFEKNSKPSVARRVSGGGWPWLLALGIFAGFHSEDAGGGPMNPRQCWILMGGALTATLGTLSCGAQNPVKAAATTTVSGPTYYKDVQPLIAAKCAGCHSEGGIAPFPLDTYQAAQVESGQMASATQSRLMPPWLASDVCNSYLDDRSLTDAQIQLLQDWNANGSPMGDASQASPIVDTDAGSPVADLGTPSLVVQSPSPYVPTSTGNDDYHCFVVDPQLMANQDVVAVNVIPGNPRIVHHVILYEVEQSDLPQLAQLQASGDGHGGYTCFGDSGIDSANWVAVWAPGGMPTRFPAGTGIPVHAGSKLVMQVHYNLLNGRGQSDQSSVALYYSNGPVAKEAAVYPIPQTLLDIPANDPSYTTGLSYTLPPGQDATIWGVAGHMHLLGTQFTMQLEPQAPPDQCLLTIPDWNFYWQMMFWLQTPVTAHAGDTIRFDCTYDNSQAHQPIVNGVQQTSHEVWWGEGTLDEMCLALVYVTSP
jgi:hypothetical protein